MKILPVIQSSTYKEHSCVQPNFTSKFYTEKIGKVVWESTITAGGITAAYGTNKAFRNSEQEKYKMLPEELEKYLQQQKGKSQIPPKIYNETKENNQIIFKGICQGLPYVPAGIPGQFRGRRGGGNGVDAH